MAIYARGREEFAERFEELEPAVRARRLDLETFIHYHKPLRNLQIQEGRLQRQREKDMFELRELQEERRQAEQPQTAALANTPNPAGEIDIAFLESLYEKATGRIRTPAPSTSSSSLASIFQIEQSRLFSPNL
jgi:hypothetical protein